MNMNAHTDGHFGNSSPTDGGHTRGSKPLGIPLGRSQSRNTHVSRPQQFQKLAQGSNGNRPRSRHIWSYSSHKERENADYDKLNPATLSPEDSLRPNGLHYSCTEETPEQEDTTQCGQTPKGRGKRINSSTSNGEFFHDEQLMSTSVPASPLIIQRKALHHRSSSGMIEYGHVSSYS